MSVVIREWTKEDIPILSEMELRCFQDAWTKEMLSDTLRYPVYHCFLAEEGGQVCGYCCLIVVCEDAEIGNIAVDLPYRGRGISNALMQAMHDRAKEMGATQAFLEVRVSNQTAISLYRKFGYEPYGVRKKYYDDGEDALVMKRSL